jgi:hypothetical protein
MRLHVAAAIIGPDRARLDNVLGRSRRHIANHQWSGSHPQSRAPREISISG